MTARSRTGCLTCRQRKLKCSEERPICAQCAKANRECVPSSGITFRHQQNPSMNGENGDHDNLKSFYGYKETFGKSTKWVEIPKDLTFVHTSNPYDDEDGDHLRSVPSFHHHDFGAMQRDEDLNARRLSYSAYATHGLEALSAAASQDQFDYGAPAASMTQRDRTTPQSTASPQHHIAPSQNLDFILNPASTLSPEENNIDPRLHAQTPADTPQSQQTASHVRTTFLSSRGERIDLREKGASRRAAIEDPELGFLLRDYAERPGTWMDVFDLNLFFAATVPVLAMACPLLLYACAALSAKSLARVGGRKPVLGGMVHPSRQSNTERWPGLQLDQEGWFHRARQYYDTAVSLLRQALAGASRPSTATNAEENMTSFAGQPATDSDELVAATAILCVYEFLDASGLEWGRHLDGAKSLFDIAKDRMMLPMASPPSPVSDARRMTLRLTREVGHARVASLGGLSVGRRAVFWNFARQDMLSAFINNTPTRLDTADLAMWCSAGLKLTLEGFVSTSNSPSNNAMCDDMVSNALVWLTMKLVNFIADGNSSPMNPTPLTPGNRQRERWAYWKSLDRQLEVWYNGLGDHFHPTVMHIGVTPDDNEAWFSRSMCASSMQWYHFCRVQLLHNVPRVSDSISANETAGQHASYADTLAQSRHHAKQIVAIALGRHDEGTRIHAVQPLWTAGLVLGTDDEDGGFGAISLETKRWRRKIVGLLRGIEYDMGWAAEYRIQSLLHRWGGLPSTWPESTRNEDTFARPIG